MVEGGSWNVAVQVIVQSKLCLLQVALEFRNSRMLLGKQIQIH